MNLMPAASALLKSITRAAAQNIGSSAEFAPDRLLTDAWESWREATPEEQRRADVEALALLTAADVARAVQEETGGLADDQRARVAAYVGQVPSLLRRSLRRTSDPSGKSAPPSLSFRGAEDLLPFLPTGMPRFQAGARPLAGVDWELTDLLGVGGFGEVWKAKNPRFDGIPPVALKFFWTRRPRNGFSRTRPTSSTASCARVSTTASCRCCTPT
jgi:hypothetical protein